MGATPCKLAGNPEERASMKFHVSRGLVALAMAATSLSAVANESALQKREAQRAEQQQKEAAKQAEKERKEQLAREKAERAAADRQEKQRQKDEAKAAALKQKEQQAQQKLADKQNAKPCAGLSGHARTDCLKAGIASAGAKSDAEEKKTKQLDTALKVGCGADKVAAVGAGEAARGGGIAYEAGRKVGDKITGQEPCK